MASASKVVLLLVLFLCLVGVFFGSWLYLSNQGFFLSPGELREQLAESERVRDLLADENADLKDAVDDLSAKESGIPFSVIASIFVAALLLAFVALQSNSLQGRRISLKEAERFVKDELLSRYRIGHKSVFPNDPRSYVQCTPFTGFLVDGDPEGLWYGFEFATDLTLDVVGSVPDELAFCVLIRSIDFDNQFIVEFGLNKDSVCKKHSSKLQRTAEPTDVGRLISGISDTAKLRRDFEDLTKEVDE